MSNGFPVRLSLIALFITLAVFAGEITLLKRAHSELDKIQKVGIPLMQTISASLRLVEQSDYLMQLMVSQNQLVSRDEYDGIKDALYESMEEADKLTKKTSKNKIADALSVTKEMYGEDTAIFAALKQKRPALAAELYSSRYAVSVNKVRERLSNDIFQISLGIEESMASNNRIFIVFLTSSVAAMAIVVGIWLFVIGAYKKNTKARILAEKSLEEERARSAHSAKMSALGEMAGGVAHEINSPLAIIQLVSETTVRKLRAGKITNEDIALALEKISKTNTRMAKIVNALRSFSRDGRSDKLEVVSTSHLMSEVLSLASDKFKFSGIELRVPAENECEFFFDGRQTEIEQVVINLLNNSLDAIQNLREKWVEVSIRKDGGNVLIIVTDSGRGIPDEIAEKVMQPFFTTKEVGSGTGLGLSVSLGIAKMHNGLLAYDKSSENTRFILTLPSCSGKIATAG